MSRFVKVLFCSTAFFYLSSAQAYLLPNSNVTPGILCSQQDPNFIGFSYSEKIPRCVRKIGLQEKLIVAKSYGDIPESEWSNYEFDHLIPLCVGGSNDPRNLWPQPLAEARDKDVIELEVCAALKSGKMKQAEAVKKIFDWLSRSRTQ